MNFIKINFNINVSEDIWRDKILEIFYKHLFVALIALGLFVAFIIALGLLAIFVCTAISKRRSRNLRFEDSSQRTAQPLRNCATRFQDPNKRAIGTLGPAPFSIRRPRRMGDVAPVRGKPSRSALRRARGPGEGR
jgi:hypothetical protein